ncbi:hypothetical protein SKAU_G00349340 [Synaphobranchus kaupii]|uniref:Uncharacterized protein n=1 Tax=Synaphobranchus kaupii TaxID=118154 RepID=A0A9Q1EK23_SYNKA|nr:hypothetical protein SKAU_G00349340 [Synaphobranchus kaupii]
MPACSRAARGAARHLPLGLSPAWTSIARPRRPGDSRRHAAEPCRAVLPSPCPSITALTASRSAAAAGK